MLNKKMKIFFYLYFAFTLASCEKIEISDYKGDFETSIMSFNLRYDNQEDGKNKWDNRKLSCITMLQELAPSIIGVQEGQQQQIDFLEESLTNYDYVGEINQFGPWGEYKAIFYDKNKFKLLNSSTFWLSETPEIESLGWDANNIRIVTWAKLNDLEKNRIIYVFNTHFDHKGKLSQKESSKLLVQKIQEITGNDVPIFITGDFNMLIGNSRLNPIRENYFSAQRSANKSDDNKSFNAFGRWYLNRNIDFIFHKNAKALSYKTIVKDYGIPFISDHYPIISHFNYN
jgi:endonuclease/exonuclease/phosphatase family metal-dependent hydrolase